MVHVSALTLGAAAFVDLLIAALFVYVAMIVARRSTSAKAHRASLAFAAWWGGVGVTIFTNALREGLAAGGLHNAPAARALLDLWQYVYVVALVVAVAGLVYYLVYLYTGNGRWFWPLVAFYSAYGLTALALIARMQPAGVTPGKWFVTWAYVNPQAGGAIFLVLVLLLLLPQIVGSALYLSLRRRLQDPMGRYRVTMVGGAILVWQSIQLLAPFVRLGQFEWWQAGGRLMGLAAALIVLAAYRPPAFVRRWLGLPEVA